MTLRQRRRSQQQVVQRPAARHTTSPSHPSPKQELKPRLPPLSHALIPILLAYLTVITLLLISPTAQRHLTYLNLISFNVIFPPSDPTRYHLHARPITIEHINAWHIPPPYPPTTNFTESLLSGQRVIIYHHGNAGSRAWPRRVEAVRILANHLHAHVISFDYTGFGDTPGQPSESIIYKDSETVYQWVTNNTMDADIFLYGQSLGTFPVTQLATQLCQQQRPNGVILEAPPASLIEAALTHPAAKPFRVFPRMKHLLKMVLWEQLDSHAKIGSVCLPLLIMHGDKDDMIPMKQGMDLYNAAKMAGVDVRFFNIVGHGHKDVNAAKGYLTIVQQFLDRYSSVAVPTRLVAS